MKVVFKKPTRIWNQQKTRFISFRFQVVFAFIFLFLSLPHSIWHQRAHQKEKRNNSDDKIYKSLLTGARRECTRKDSSIINKNKRSLWLLFSSIMASLYINTDIHVCVCARAQVDPPARSNWIRIWQKKKKKTTRNNKLCPTAARAPCIIYVHLDRHDLLCHTHVLCLNWVCLPAGHEINNDKKEITFHFTQWTEYE